MKKILISMSFILILISCNQKMVTNDSSSKTETPTTSSQETSKSLFGMYEGYFSGYEGKIDGTLILNQDSTYEYHEESDKNNQNHKEWAIKPNTDKGKYTINANTVKLDNGQSYAYENDVLILLGSDGKKSEVPDPKANKLYKKK